MNTLNGLLIWGTNKGVKILAILIAAFLVNYILQVFITRIVKKRIKNKTKRSRTLISIFGGTSKFVISIILILMILPELGINIAALLAGVGVMGLAIGMASREIVADFLAGIFILIEDQYSVGDVIKVSGIEGEVKEITLRRTLIRDNTGMIHAIPNGQIKTVARKIDVK